MVTRLHTGVAAAGVLGLSLISGCSHYSHRQVSLQPAAEPVVFEEIRGIVLTREAGGEAFVFSEVFDVRWTPEALEIDGRLDERGSPHHGRENTFSFSYADVSRLLVQAHPSAVEIRPLRAGAGLGGLIGGMAGVVTFLAWFASGWT